MKVIAECGCNWTSLDGALLMIKEAKEVGCWAAKFQVFTPELAREAKIPEFLSLSKGDIRYLFDYGKEIDMEVFFTPMYLEAVDWCEEIGVAYYKIRYKDHENGAILHKIWETNKPYFISVNKEISYTPDQILLYCVPKYPATIHDYFVSEITEFEGISDHTPDLEFFKRLGNDYEYWEKHVKLDNTKPLEDAWSVSFSQLKEVIDNFRN